MEQQPERAEQPELAGRFPIISHKGFIVCFVHVYRGYEEYCHKRGIVICNAISAFDNETSVDNYEGVPNKVTIEKKLVGILPIFNNRGYPICVIQIYEGEENECHERGKAAAMAIAAFEGEDFEDRSEA